MTLGWSGALDQSTKRPQLFPVTLTSLHVVFPPRLLGQEITIDFIWEKNKIILSLFKVLMKIQVFYYVWENKVMSKNFMYGTLLKVTGCKQFLLHFIKLNVGTWLTQTIHYRPTNTLQTKQYTTDQTVHYRPNTTVQTKHYTTDQTVHYRPNSTLQTKQYTTDQTVHYRPNSILLTKQYTTDQTIHYWPNNTLQTHTNIWIQTKGLIIMLFTSVHMQLNK